MLNVTRYLCSHPQFAIGLVFASRQGNIARSLARLLARSLALSHGAKPVLGSTLSSRYLLLHASIPSISTPRFDSFKTSSFTFERLFDPPPLRINSDNYIMIKSSRLIHPYVYTRDVYAGSKRDSSDSFFLLFLFSYSLGEHLRRKERGVYYPPITVSSPSTAEGTARTRYYSPPFLFSPVFSARVPAELYLERGHRRVYTYTHAHAHTHMYIYI